MNDESQKIRRPVRVHTGFDAEGKETFAIISPLAQLDGGNWGTDETNDTSELRQKMGLMDRQLPPERRSIEQDDVIV